VGDIGVYGNGQTYSVYGDGATYAVYGYTGAAAGTGVYAYSAQGPGVVSWGYTNGVEATGITRGIYTTGGTYGIVAGANASGGAGVYGSNGGNASTYGGFFENDVRVTRNLVVDGSVFKGGGGFKIDHPIDPSERYLYHSFVESPDMKNMYDGVATTDANGEAVVTLPEWFGAVNSDFRYQLTAIGAPGPNLHIAQKITGNQFRIAGGTPGMEVSWQVTGIRQDAYAKAHRIPVEEAKPATERGKYLHPRELGFPESLGIHYELMQKMAAEQTRLEEARGKAEADRKRHEERQATIGQDRPLHGKPGESGK
jgi:hypothetical protein